MLRSSFCWELTGLAIFWPVLSALYVQAFDSILNMKLSELSILNQEQDSESS